jgi:hypothetical protein
MLDRKYSIEGRKSAALFNGARRLIPGIIWYTDLSQDPTR